jgi:hypothetical protein
MAFIKTSNNQWGVKGTAAEAVAKLSDALAEFETSDHGKRLLISMNSVGWIEVTDD